MKEERDMLVLSLPFVAAVAAGQILSPSHEAAFLAAAALFGMILYFWLRAPRSVAYYIILMFCCGLFCSFTGRLLSLSDVAEDGLPAFLRAQLAGCVDGLSFKSGDTGAMVKALVLGDRSGLTPQLTQAFRASGAAHVLALSGLHLGIFYLCLSWILKPLGNSPTAKKIKSFTIMILAGAYVVLAGASASLVRALLFIVLRESAALLHRKISLLRILLAALTLQLIFSPGQIATPGFQLSYLAVAGIAILYPWLEGLYPKADNDRFNIPRKIWQLCSLSISCQVFTTPVAWLQFGSLPKYFLLANLLIMPLATAFTAVSIFIVFLAPIGLCPGFLLSAADVFSNLMIQILTIIAGM